ncbi:MAG: stage III sporulation protein AC [Clostridia bacterium]|nr:stage III sporulation protein AC [Clostridia bacterium]
MDVSVLFKLAGLGLLTSMVNVILKKSDKEEIATVVTLAALVLALLTVLDMVAGLFDNVRAVFGLY